MGLFFKVENKGKYLHIRRRKFTLSGAFIFSICYLAFLLLAPSMSITDTLLPAIGKLFFLLMLCCMWLALEGIYYGYFMPKKYEKQDKKVIRFIGEGIKIEK